MTDSSQPVRPELSESSNYEHDRMTKDPSRDLPPKSPNHRRLMPALPTKTKRGEVMKQSINNFKH
jgi:hypothetical protein